ncbi:hypothetical protein HPSD74_0571 [Glaesserella parasuis D74]|nr:hypothetical protein HPSD74_0571 [Glaesserella parasuis D74]
MSSDKDNFVGAIISDTLFTQPVKKIITKTNQQKRKLNNLKRCGINKTLGIYHS